MRAILAAAILSVSAMIPASAYACDTTRMGADLRWCMSDANKSGFGDIIVGSCQRDAVKLRNGFRSCQGDKGVRDNYDSCTAGVQIDTARAVGQSLNSYQPGQCGF